MVAADRWRRTRALITIARAAWFLALLLLAASARGESRCFGTVSDGRIEESVRLPSRGSNFEAYSALGVAAGRTHVHSKVAAIVVAACADLAAETPSAKYVYGETGWQSGGRIQPHRTHQNGLSVDFFVPIRNGEGESVPLPTTFSNRFGYDVEFDARARSTDLRIDFAALAEHLYRLHRAAKSRGVRIERVIFDSAYLTELFSTRHGPYLRDHLPFMKRRPWIRHDEHYHVDFAIACRPKAG